MIEIVPASLLDRPGTTRSLNSAGKTYFFDPACMKLVFHHFVCISLLTISYSHVCTGSCETDTLHTNCPQDFWLDFVKILDQVSDHGLESENAQ